MNATPTPARARLLEAAERLVAESGAAHLTLDAVASAAGVSKGGLLYHFPNKEALLAAMVERYLDDLGECVAEAARTDAGAAANPLRAHVLGLLEALSANRPLGSALLAASGGDPGLLDPCREYYARSLAELSRLPCGFEGAALVLLATDGLLLGELLRISPFTPAQREQLVAALLRIAEAPCPAVAAPGGEA
jgi:AcrR family transcriptional regulator